MRVIAIDHFASPGSLHDFPVPEPQANEILVRVAASGVNPVDWKTRDGMSGDKPLPLVLGQDFAGTVERTGTGVTDVRAGDRVFGMARVHGAYAEYTTVANDGNGSAYAKTPQELDDATAAALPTAGLTALASLVWLGAKSGTTVAILGATGGVGAIATQIAHARGAHVIATMRANARDIARDLGADETIAYDAEPVIERILTAHPDGIDAVLDLVSDGDELEKLAAVLRPGGKLISTIHVADEAWFSERGYEAKNIALAETPQASPEGLAELASLVVAGTVRITIARRAPLDEANAVLEASKSGELHGKAVLAVRVPNLSAGATNP